MFPDVELPEIVSFFYIGFDNAVAMLAQSHKIAQFIGCLVIAIKVSKGDDMMYWKSWAYLLLFTALASIAISGSGLFRLFRPIFAAMAVMSTFPAWIVWPMPGNATGGAFHRTKPSMHISFLDNEFSVAIFANLFESRFFSRRHCTLNRTMTFIDPACWMISLAAFQACFFFAPDSHPRACSTAMLSCALPAFMCFKFRATHLTGYNYTSFSAFLGAEFRALSTWKQDLEECFTTTFADELLRGIATVFTTNHLTPLHVSSG